MHGHSAPAGLTQRSNFPAERDPVAIRANIFHAQVWQGSANGITRRQPAPAHNRRHRLQTMTVRALAQATARASAILVSVFEPLARRLEVTAPRYPQNAETR
jgi:hypothetical protein